jgi:hypothetical protein
MRRGLQISSRNALTGVGVLLVVALPLRALDARPQAAVPEPAVVQNEIDLDRLVTRFMDHVGASPSGSTIVEFEKAAAASDKFFDFDCVVHDRLDCANQAGRELVLRDYPIADLEALTKHRDPRVRTLAIVSLFQKGDPKLLPVIFALVDDDAPTFPARTRVASVSPKPSREIPQTAQSVGAVAETLVTFYLRKAGYVYRSHGSVCPGFAHYWEQRKGRDYLASWFAVDLFRATRDTGDRGRALAALRSRLDALEGEDRLWYSLFVGASVGGDRIFSKAELLAVGKALGPDRLMLMLANRAPASDPDLAPKAWPSPDAGRCAHDEVGEQMRDFVLDNAAALLRPDDAKALLESPKVHQARWAIAAAVLRPDLAESILKGAIARVDGKVFGATQAILAVALVRLAGSSHAGYALDWFYSRVAAETRTTPQELFIKEVARRSDSDGRALLVQLVSDPRFDGIPEPALQTLIHEINMWLPTPLVVDPYRYVSDDEKAATFAKWRKSVRNSVPLWH